jgi:hypothetical protein
VQRAVLDTPIAIGMQDRGRESPRVLLGAHARSTNKKPVRLPPNGFRTCDPASSPGRKPTSL